VVIEAFEEWYRDEHRRVFAVVLVACGDWDVASDATDEAFTRALYHWGRVTAMASPAAWVCRVALNVMERRMRRRRMERHMLQRQVAGAAFEPGFSPEVWAAVRSLPQRQRLAVVLRYVGDLSEADIATAMGVTRGTVSASLATARARLAGLLSDQDQIKRDREGASRG
jgi:RNA polymerase sigma factor (sigma-70 family)